MIRNLINKFSTTLYVQIWEHRIKATNIQSNEVFDEKPLLEIKPKSKGKMDVVAFGNKAQPESINPFSHPRVLFSDFQAGEKLLQLIIKKLLSKSIFTPQPAVVLHPMEKTEGGLTMIEVRAFREMGYGAGAREVVVYQGEPLHPSTINFNELAEQ